MAERVYLTTTLPYVNADPHVGFAAEIIRADVIARYERARGAEVFFNTGVDEHGLKIYRQAELAGQAPQVYVDAMAAKFRALKETLNLLPELNFIRTTDPAHSQAAQAFWKICDERGFIYKKNYQIKYCVGCELEKTESELVNGRCPLHSRLTLELIDEDNYFFKFSAFQNPLLELYAARPDFVVPANRFNEIKTFVERGLADFSISRLAEKLPWGVPVPGDPSQTMYVWFDALTSYISAIGWPDDLVKFNQWWPAIQFCGKDNLRQQTAMWQAMLLAARLPPSKQIVINGFITSGGQKMSKSLGNVINPYEVVEKYGVDVLRYFVVRELNLFEDSDFTWERFHDAYNANLANGLGNLVSRIMKLAATHLTSPVSVSAPPPAGGWPEEIATAVKNFQLNHYGDFIWRRIKDLDQQIQDTQPFKVVKENPHAGADLITGLVEELYNLAFWLAPLLPETSEQIIKLIAANQAPAAPLFPRRD